MEPRPVEPQHDVIRELLGAYALGAVNADERRLVESHLAGCPDCVAELAELRAATTSLPLLAEERVPSPMLRDRLLAQAQAESAPRQMRNEVPPAGSAPQIASTREPVPLRYEAAPRRPRLPKEATIWAAAAVLLLVFSAAMVFWNLSLRQDLNDQAQPTKSVAVQFAKPENGARASLVYLPDTQVMLLNVLDMPQLPDGQVYQVWLINAKGPVPVGVFRAGDSQVAIAANPTAYQTLAVTIEPGPLGSAEPTGAKVILAPLAGQSA